MRGYWRRGSPMTLHRRRKFGDANKPHLICELTHISYNTFLHSDSFLRAIGYYGESLSEVFVSPPPPSPYEHAGTSTFFKESMYLLGFWCTHAAAGGPAAASSLQSGVSRTARSHISTLLAGYRLLLTPSSAQLYCLNG